MPILLYRILFFCLIPVGIFLLVKGIKLIRKSFNGKVLLRISFAEAGGAFTIAKEGVYAVWVSGPLFRRNATDKLRPLITNEATGETVSLNPSILSPRSNGFSTGRMEFFTFHGSVGSYRLQVVEGSSVSTFQQLIASAFPSQNVDLKENFFEVRESQKQLYTLLAIPIIIAGGFGIIGGFVGGLLVDQFMPVARGGTKKETIQKIEVVTQGGDRGYFASCTFTKDSVFHKLSIVMDSTANVAVALPIGEDEWKLLLQNIDLAEFKNSQEGPSAQPVDGTDTKITITTDTDTVSRSNAIGSATWNGIDIWSGKRCMN